MNKAGFTLFFSVGLDQQDWANLDRSGVGQVLLPFRWGDGHETRATLAELRRRGKRVVLRLSDADSRIAPATLAAQLAEYLPILRPAGVILGCEPEAGFGMHWGEDWRTDAAWTHRAQLAALLAALRPLGIPLVSPAWKQRAITEGDPPDPGVTSWREICADVYNQCDANAAHIYGHAWLSPVDEVRFRFAVQRWAELRHKLLWLDEVGSNDGDAATRMRAYLSMARILTGAAGDRVALFAPFVSNGVSDGSWSPGYLLRDPACYDQVAAFLRS